MSDQSKFAEPALDRALRLECSVQHYQWGMRGGASLVAQLTKYLGGQPCAELWMGAHPKAPAKLCLSNQLLTLDRAIEQFPEEFLGPAALAEFGARLPFLFKVLSIAEVLSLQVHPNKEAAKRLHANNPDAYPDENHKPEIAIALEPTEIVCALRSKDSLQRSLLQCPELSTLLSEQASRNGSSLDAVLPSDAFLELLKCPAQGITTASTAVSKRLCSEGPSCKEDVAFQNAFERYESSDPGLFSFYLLNYIMLSKGQAIYTPAGVPHAYISGQVIECMASSDNVIRAGLTPKFKDVDNLIKLLDPAPPLMIDAVKRDDGSLEYSVPADEFTVSALGPSIAPYRRLSRLDIVLCVKGQAELKVSGQGTSLRQGDIFLVPYVAGVREIQVAADSEVFVASIPSPGSPQPPST